MALIQTRQALAAESGFSILTEAGGKLFLQTPMPADILDGSDSKKFSESFKADPAIARDMEGGWTITRARFTRRARRVFSLGYTDLTEARKSAILKLWSDAGGASEIILDWRHPVTSELIDVRFKSSSMPSASYSGRGGTHRWDISGVTLEEV